MKASLRLNSTVFTIFLLLAFSLALVPVDSFAGDKKSGNAFLGIVTSGLNDESREALDYKDKAGILITEVVDGSAAEKAGLKHGDILIELEGKKITGVEQPGKIIGDMKPGDKIKMVVIRDGKKEKLKAELGERPAKSRKIIKMMKSDDDEEPEMGGYLGVNGLSLNEKLSKFFSVESGFIIENVGEDTPAEKAGLLVGDILTKINDEPVESFEAGYKIIRSFEPKTEVNLTVNRKGENLNLKCTLGEAARTNFQGNFEDYDFDVQGLEGLYALKALKSLEALKGLEGLENLEIIIKEALDDCDFEDECEGCEEDEGELRKEMDELRKEIKQLKEQMEKKK